MARVSAAEINGFASITVINLGTTLELSLLAIGKLDTCYDLEVMYE